MDQIRNYNENNQHRNKHAGCDISSKVVIDCIEFHKENDTNFQEKEQ